MLWLSVTTVLTVISFALLLRLQIKNRRFRSDWDDPRIVGYRYAALLSEGGYPQTALISTDIIDSPRGKSAPATVVQFFYGEGTESSPQNDLFICMLGAQLTGARRWQQDCTVEVALNDGESKFRISS